MSLKTKEDVMAFIKETVSTAVAAAVTPLKEEQTTMMKDIITSSRQPHEKTMEERGLNMARFIRCLAAGKGHVDSAHKFSEKNFGSDDEVTKALAATDFVAGGAAVPPDFVEEIIEFLRPASVVRRLNPNVLPMPSGSLTMPKQTGGAAASYVGENTNIPPSEQTTGQIKLSFKKLVTLVPISNDFLRFAMPASDSMVRDDIVAAMSQRSDLAFIRGDGASDTPKGIRNLAASGNVFAANATVNLANVTVDLGKMVLALENNNARMLRPAWIFTPRTKQYLMTVRDGNGNYVFRDEMLGGNLWGYPYATSTQIPNTLGGGTESEVYLADMSEVIIGDSTNLLIDASSEAAYHDGANVQAAFSKDQTVIRAISEHDINLRHDFSVAVLTTVKWGA